MNWIQAFNTDGESTTIAQMNAGTGSVAQVHTPAIDGKLKKIVIFLGYESASSLVEDVRVELESTLWSPNRQHFLAQGNGLQTVPVSRRSIFEYDVDLDYKRNGPIRGDYIHDSGSPVTSRIRVLFGFE